MESWRNENPFEKSQVQSDVRVIEDAPGDEDGAGDHYRIQRKSKQDQQEWCEKPAKDLLPNVRSEGCQRVKFATRMVNLMELPQHLKAM
jgi:hypothetical protein